MTILSSLILGNCMKVKIKLKIDKRNRQHFERMAKKHSPFIASNHAKQDGLDVADFSNPCALSEHEKNIFDELVNTMFGNSINPALCNPLHSMFDKNKKTGSIQFPNRPTSKSEEHTWPEVGNPVQTDDLTPKQGLMSGFDSSFSNDILINFYASVIAEAIKDKSVDLDKEQFDKIVDAVNSKF